MAKYVKFKKIIKIVGLIFLVSAIGLFSLGLGGFWVITSGATLDQEKLKPKGQNLFILDCNNKEIGSQFSPSASTIPELTKLAFIAKEDKRFYSHRGIDPIRMAGALKNNLVAKSTVEGGSTITQQLIKNTHLTQEKTINRKLKEIKLAKELEKIYSKEEILDAYLNSIYFGNNIFGIKNASSFYFDKPVSDLSLSESAILAGLISAPSVFNPVANLDKSKQKAQIVLNLMEEQEYITSAEKESATAELNLLSVSPHEKVGSLYLSFATEEALKILGMDSLPLNSEIVIKTYLNSDLQKSMEDTLNSAVYKAKDLGGTMCGIAGIVLDNFTGGIIAICGESPYNIMDLKRQPASTIKPLLVYGPAIENNLISPASFVLDEPINIDGYTPQNATKLCYGWTTVRDNIVRSTNIPAVKILHETGISQSKAFASRLGIKFDKEDDHLAIALGGFNSGVGIKELATAYMALARGGNYMPSTFIKEISINGEVCYQHNPRGEQIMKESTAYLLTDMLKSVAQYGTGRKINDLGIPVASKTGTNAIDGINHDGWNVSYTTEHTALCWTGNLGPVADHSSSQYNGSLYATYFVKDLFSALYDGRAPQDFSQPNSVVQVQLDKSLYDQHKLFWAEDFSNESVTEVFATDNLPPRLSAESIDGYPLSDLAKSRTHDESLIDYSKFIRRYGSW